MRLIIGGRDFVEIISTLKVCTISLSPTRTHNTPTHYSLQVQAGTLMMPGMGATGATPCGRHAKAQKVRTFASFL